MLPEGFEPSIPVSEQAQIQALDRAATGIGRQAYYLLKYATLPIEG
jgi:hypothetical protein